MTSTSFDLTFEHKKRLANAVRMLSVDAVDKANSGHPGLPLGAADFATVLFADFLNFNPKDPKWPNRDRFVLSAGHGSMLLYSLLHLTGYDAMTIEEIQNFRQFNSLTPGHPEVHHTPGVETTTGPLGQGLANAVGMALGQELMAARFGEKLINNYTYALVGDGCLMEGISQEAISLAGHLRLHRLIVLFDDNGITIDGRTDLSTSEDTQKRFESAGWHCQRIDGHNYEEITKALQQAKESDQPSFIACRTLIGYGAPTKEDTNKIHGSPLGEDERNGLAKNLNWEYAPFKIPQEIYTNWQRCLERCDKIYDDWQETFKKLAPENQQEFNAFLNKEHTLTNDVVHQYCQTLSNESPKKATRQLSQMALEELTHHVPELIGGSADLTGSNNTKASHMVPIEANEFKGSYIYYGVREHAMGAIMNGLSLYGGFIPYGGTFLTFTDYMRPAIRLSALMGTQVIYVMTHDSIGLGEDGPTHQPIEHLASLRAIPNLLVFRPCDGVETMESWQVAIEQKSAPSILALTRQGLPTLRHDISENLTRKGGYVLQEAFTTPELILIASGSEVALAAEVQGVLQNKRIPTRLVSMPCVELFEQQDQSYQASVLGETNSIRVTIEAGITQGWDKYTGDHGLAIGINQFGASAPANELFDHFGLTKEKVLDKIEKHLENQLSKGKQHHDIARGH